jgi:hypothetical protein
MGRTAREGKKRRHSPMPQLYALAYPLPPRQAQLPIRSEGRSEHDDGIHLLWMIVGLEGETGNAHRMPQ